MGYPIRILVEDGIVEIVQLKLIIGIENGLHAIMVFHRLKPRQHATLKLVSVLVAGLLLDVKYGGQIAGFELHSINEM
jgi:hypothetical protein